MRSCAFISFWFIIFFFFFKQKTAYEMRISDWSSDVCSSDLQTYRYARAGGLCRVQAGFIASEEGDRNEALHIAMRTPAALAGGCLHVGRRAFRQGRRGRCQPAPRTDRTASELRRGSRGRSAEARSLRSEEHTSELQSLMRISYAVFCLKK